MQLPPEGICVRCTWVKNRDGDTVEVRLRTGQVAAIRLDGIDAPETSSVEGRQAKAFLDSLLEKNDEPVHVHIGPFTDTNGDGILDLKEILAGMTFDRIPGHLFIGTEDVGEVLIRHGHALPWQRGKQRLAADSR